MDGIDDGLGRFRKTGTARIGRIVALRLLDAPLTLEIIIATLFFKGLPVAAVGTILPVGATVSLTSRFPV